MSEWMRMKWKKQFQKKKKKKKSNAGIIIK